MLTCIGHETATQSTLIQGMVDDLGDEVLTNSIPIPIPEAKETVLGEVIRWCESGVNGRQRSEQGWQKDLSMLIQVTYVGYLQSVGASRRC